MKHRTVNVIKMLIVCVIPGAAGIAHAQYTPPPPPEPFSGFINEALRAENPTNKWDIGGTSRSRGEFKEGNGIAGAAGSVDFRAHGADVNNEYFLERIRLHVGYSNTWWSAYVEGQSSLAVSDERFAYVNTAGIPHTTSRHGSGPESDTIDLHQAYAVIGNMSEFPVTLKAGRQVLSYGEERLIGAFDWNNISRTFDAAKIRVHTEWFDADLFTSHPVIPEDERFDVPNIYDWFSGIYATSSKIPKNNLDVYFLARNASSEAINFEPSPQFPQPTARDIYTVGGRLKSRAGELGNWDYSLEGAYQFGDYKATATSKRLTQDAFAVVAQAGYTFSDLWGKPRLGLEYDFSSGDSNSSDGKHQTFDILFPTSHKFNGYMNFLSLDNIHDLRAIFQIKPCPRLSLAVEGHGFWLADTRDAFYNVSGVARTTGGYGIHPGYSSFVGTELDVIAGYALTKFAQLEVGYGHFFTGEYVQQSLAASGGNSDANYVYTQLTVSF